VGGCGSGCHTYTFVSEYIRELGTLENIRAEAEHDLHETNANVLADCIRNSTRFQLELNSDVSIIKSFGAQFKSLSAQLNELIPNLTGLYQKKVELYQQLSDGCSTLIAGPQPNVDYAKLTAEAPKINATLEYIDKTLFDVTPLIFATLIDQRPDSENHLSHLVITKAERDKLVRGLNLEFGEKLSQEHQNYTVSGASVLEAYLEKGYRCSDDPW
jgi:hypothetical protein